MINPKFSPLIQAAQAALEKAYAPYSKFPVGAALLADNGTIFTGCNVENISYGLTICAERVAIGNAIAAGIQKFEAIAITACTEVPISPCGACRQVLAEFAPDLLVLSISQSGEVAEFRLSNLLPRARTGILNQK